MFTVSNPGVGRRRLFSAAALLAASLIAPALARAADGSGRWFAVEFPPDAPVSTAGFDLGPTTATPRGSSMVIDLNASLTLRNVSSKPISGVALRVEAQDLSPLGKGSVLKPSLFIAPGEVFSVKINMQLIRPIAAARSESAMVQVLLDSVLFSDLKAYGPDRLNLRKTLVVYEMEARRDRQYLARLLTSGRDPELRQELVFDYQEFRPLQLALEMLRGPQSSDAHEQSVSVNPVNFPKAPVQPLGGAAQVAGNEVRSPRVDVKNVSKQSVSGVAMGWIVHDESGKDFVTSALTSRSPIAPVETSWISQAGTLRFSLPSGRPMVISSLMTFVNDVEFSDGTVWIPSRDDIDAATPDLTLRRELASSPEKQRLANIYHRDGLEGLRKELRRVSALADQAN